MTNDLVIIIVVIIMMIIISCDRSEGQMFCNKLVTNEARYCGRLTALADDALIKL